MAMMVTPRQGRYSLPLWFIAGGRDRIAGRGAALVGGRCTADPGSDPDVSHGTDPQTHEFFYWVKEAFGFKPVVSLNHTGVDTGATTGRVTIVTTQIYASHLYRGLAQHQRAGARPTGERRLRLLLGVRESCPVGRLSGVLGVLARPILQRRARSGLRSSRRLPGCAPPGSTSAGCATWWVAARPSCPTSRSRTSRPEPSRSRRRIRPRSWPPSIRSACPATSTTNYSRFLAATLSGKPPRYAVLDVGTNSVKFHMARSRRGWHVGGGRRHAAAAAGQLGRVETPDVITSCHR